MIHFAAEDFYRQLPQLVDRRFSLLGLNRLDTLFLVEIIRQRGVFHPLKSNYAAPYYIHNLTLSVTQSAHHKIKGVLQDQWVMI